MIQVRYSAAWNLIQLWPYEVVKVVDGVVLTPSEIQCSSDTGTTDIYGQDVRNSCRRVTEIPSSETCCVAILSNCSPTMCTSIHMMTLFKTSLTSVAVSPILQCDFVSWMTLWKVRALMTCTYNQKADGGPEININFRMQGSYALCTGGIATCAWGHIQQDVYHEKYCTIHTPHHVSYPSIDPPHPVNPRPRPAAEGPMCGPARCTPGELIMAWIRQGSTACALM